jgi:hypothetical protein
MAVAYDFAPREEGTKQLPNDCLNLPAFNKGL